MVTSMHRLQISLPEWQVQFLSEQAKRDGISIAEAIRQMIRREAETVEEGSPETLWDIAGIIKSEGPLIGAIPVSEEPELYLAADARQETGLSEPGGSGQSVDTDK